jgi:hypothetical protein
MSDNLYEGNEHYMSRAEEMYHYGVKGMRWGVITQRVSSGGRRAAEKLRSAARNAGTAAASKARIMGQQAVASTKSKAIATAKKPFEKKQKTEGDIVKALKRKKMSQLSNKELAVLNERLRLEMEYKRVTKDSGKLARGMRLAKNITTAVTVIGGVYALKNQPLVKDIAKLMLTQKGVTKAVIPTSTYGQQTPLAGAKMTMNLYNKWNTK